MAPSDLDSIHPFTSKQDLLYFFPPGTRLIQTEFTAVPQHSAPTPNCLEDIPMMPYFSAGVKQFLLQCSQPFMIYSYYLSHGLKHAHCNLP